MSFYKSDLTNKEDFIKKLNALGGGSGFSYTDNVFIAKGNLGNNIMEIMPLYNHVNNPINLLGDMITVVFTADYIRGYELNEGNRYYYPLILRYGGGFWYGEENNVTDVLCFYRNEQSNGYPAPIIGFDPVWSLDYYVGTGYNASFAEQLYMSGDAHTFVLGMIPFLDGAQYDYGFEGKQNAVFSTESKNIPDSIFLKGIKGGAQFVAGAVKVGDFFCGNIPVLD